MFVYTIFSKIKVWNPELNDQINFFEQDFVTCLVQQSVLVVGRSYREGTHSEIV